MRKSLQSFICLTLLASCFSSFAAKTPKCKKEASHLLSTAINIDIADKKAYEEARDNIQEKIDYYGKKDDMKCQDIYQKAQDIFQLQLDVIAQLKRFKGYN